MIKKFISRGIWGLGAIYIVNQLLQMNGISIALGFNLCTLLIAGSLGIPGVGLLYGILFYQFL